MRIWKYPLELTDLNEVKMPLGALTLTVQVQDETPCLWATVHENETRMETRRFAIYGTGNPMPHDPGFYIATFQMAGGALVFHAFELR